MVTFDELNWHVEKQVSNGDIEGRSVT